MRLFEESEGKISRCKRVEQRGAPRNSNPVLEKVKRGWCGINYWTRFKQPFYLDSDGCQQSCRHLQGPTQSRQCQHLLLTVHKACLPALSDHIWSHFASYILVYVSLSSRHTEKRSLPVTQFCHALSVSLADSIFVDAFKPLETAGISARLATCIRKTQVDSNNAVHMIASKMWKAILVSNQ